MCYFVTLFWLGIVSKLPLLSLCTTLMLEWLARSNHSNNQAIRQSSNLRAIPWRAWNAAFFQ